MAADGGNPRELVKGTVNGGTAWLPDGSHVVYYKSGQLQRLDLATGQSLQLTDESRVMPIMIVSPDGKSVVYQSTASGNVDLRVVSIDGGPSRAVVATPHEDYHPSFSPSGRWLYFQPDHKNLVRVPGPAQEWRSTPPEQVTHFPESGLLVEDIQPSPDGRQLAFARGRITADVWILNLHR
jgi:Tol biopolymer transport system component